MYYIGPVVSVCLRCRKEMLDILNHYAPYRPAAVIHNRYASNPFSPHQPEGLERRLVLANLPISPPGSSSPGSAKNAFSATVKQGIRFRNVYLDDLAESHDGQSDLGERLGAPLLEPVEADALGEHVHDGALRDDVADGAFADIHHRQALHPVLG